MSAISELLARYPTPTFPPDELLISSDGVPLESDWHVIEISLLRELVHQQLAGRQDFFAGGNMFIYFDEEHARNRNFRGPDFFFVWGASPMPLRPYWAVWKEGGRYPDVIIELLSQATADVDLATKKDIYEQVFHTSEYFCYDPDARKLDGWRLEKRKYRPIKPNEKGWLESEQLGLWLGTWSGLHLNRDTTWLRFYTPEGILVPTIAESTAMAQQRAAVAQQQAAVAQQAINEQRRRAEVAEAELARLKAQIEQKKNSTP